MKTQALGIIGKVVTGPWMRMVGRPDLNILDMNPYYAEAQGKLESWSEDASPLLGPSAPSVFADVPIMADVVLDSIMQTTSSNEKTVTLLQDLCKACLAVVNRQLKSQLDGGIHCHPSEALRQKASSYSATNIGGERNFTFADRIDHHAPNAIANHIECKTMFCVNKTANWMHGMASEEKIVCVGHARINAKNDARECKLQNEKLQTNIQVKHNKSRWRQKILDKENSDRKNNKQWFQLAFEHGGL